MTDAQLLEIQQYALRMHHEFAKALSGQDNYSVPGNDPKSPN
jgi:hypothetical protein